MFNDSLLDSAWAHDSRRGWTTVLSFAVQAVAVAILLLLPLIYGEGMPGLQWTAHIVAPTPPPASAPPTQARATPPPASNLASDGRIVPPSQIPDHVAEIHDEVEPPPMVPGPYVPGGTGGRWSANPVANSIFESGTNVLPPPVHPTVTHPPIVSHIMEGNLIHKIQPDYPPLAREARIQGPVLLQAIISREGTIENLQVLSGHPMLVKAAVDAVRQWRYRPYVLNGEPVKVETQVTVNFILGGG
jgi:protein TonB